MDKQEIIVVDCYDFELEDIVNNKLGGWQNIIDLKLNRGGDDVPYCLVIAKKTEQNKNVRRINTR